METLARLLRSLGPSGALENAARECRVRIETEAALEERLAVLSAGRRRSVAA